MFQILDAGLEDMQARGEILPVLCGDTSIGFRLPAQVHHGSYHPNRQNDSDTDQGEHDKDAKGFHDCVRRPEPGGKSAV